MRSRPPVQDEASPLSEEKRRLYAYLLTSLAGIIVGVMEAILSALAEMDDHGPLRRATADLPKQAAFRLALAALRKCAAELEALAEKYRAGLPDAGDDAAADAPPATSPGSSRSYGSATRSVSSPHSPSPAPLRPRSRHAGLGAGSSHDAMRPAPPASHSSAPASKPRKRKTLEGRVGLRTS